MTLALNGTAIADGSSVASGSVVGVGTAGLLSPGVGNRVLRTSLPAGTAYRAGSAVAPEGWTINYSTDGGTGWSPTEPATASDVTDVRASATVAAGLIEGAAQVYSSETTSAIPSSSFSASTGGDGWGITFYDDYIFNVFHHDNSAFRLACHVRSTGNRCAAFSGGYIEYGGYAAAMRSDVAIDQSTGRLYGFTFPTSGTDANRPGLLCLDVTKVDTSAPTSCGFIPLSTANDVNNYGYLSDLISVGRRIFGVESANANSLLCFDAATGAMCPGSPLAVDGASGDSWGRGGSRAIAIGNRVFVRTSSKIYCYQAANLTQECADAENWPVTITSNTSDPQVAVHTNVSGTPDGICSLNECVNLTGQVQAGWTNPFTLGTGGNQWAYAGATTVGRFYWSVHSSMNCFDFATNGACAGFTSPSWGQLYMVEVDPQNPACLWTNSDEGAIKVVNAYTGAIGCSGNPVITLQPSQFAPRYACSTSSGIVEWTSLRLVSLGGGGSASSVSLTVRDANGDAVPGWSNKAVPITPGANPLGELDMTGLDPAVSGSRPTFSFTFSGITGSITTAVIALDYKGKGPELCLDVDASTASPPQDVTVTGTLTESVGVQETFTDERNFTIDTATSIVTQGVPSAPLSLSGSGLNTSATLSFRVPSSDGGTPITGYQISTDGGGSWTPASIVVSGDGSLSTSISGLTPGQTYSVKVAAVNKIGRGTAAAISLEAQLLTVATLVDVPLNQGPVTLAASSGGRLVTYTASPASVCTSGGEGGRTITLVAVGTCNLVAYQAGDPNANPVILPAETPGSFRVLPPFYVTTAPGIPTELAARPASGQVRLSWTAPLDDGNSAITDYSVQYKSGASWIPFIDGVSTATSALVTGLSNGTTYSFRVAAKNSVGIGAYTSSVICTPATVPGPPTSVAAVGSSTSRSLTWNAPESTGGTPITDYLVEYKLATDPTWTTFTDGISTGTAVTVTGLTDGLAYDFQVTTINAVGASDPTNTVTLSVTPGSGQMALAWSAPENPGGTITDYSMQVRAPGGEWTTVADAVSTTPGGVVTGLINGTTYNFRVATIIDNGPVGSFTSVVAATPRTVPTAPSDLAAAPGNRQVGLSWSAPSNGGSAITDYVVEFRPTAGGSWSTFVDGISPDVGVIVTGLLNGTSYDFRVTTVNIVGSSSPSTTVTAAPRTVPGVPGAVTATIGAGSLGLSWSAPSGTGGAPLIDYVIEYKLAADLSWSIAPHSPSTATTFTLTGLTGHPYNVRVAAVNAAGTGEFTTTILATPDAPLAMAAPTVSGVSPGRGGTAGGTSVTITGAGFVDGASARFGLNQATNVVVVNGTTITATTPTGPPGAVDVTVTNPDAQSGTAIAGYTYVNPTPKPPPSASPTPTPTPTPTPVPVPSPMPAGDSLLLVDGQPRPVTVDPKPGANGLIVTADDWSMDLDGLGPDGKPLRLGPDGTLILQSERDLQTSGTGFQGGSRVDLFIDPPVNAPRMSASANWLQRLVLRASNGTYVGTVHVDANGTFRGVATLPADVAPGDHILQAVGLSPSGQTRALSLGVRVEPSLVLDMGSRKRAGMHDRITATGSSTGIPAGVKVTHHIKFAGQAAFSKGKAIAVVQSDGTFTWSWLIRKNRAITVYVSYKGTKSNQVVWGPRSAK